MSHVTEHGQLVIYREGEYRIAQSFERFHRENPHVYESLLRLARKWRERRPNSRCGIGMLYEVARWDLALSTEGEPLRLNNNYRAYYARLLMEEPGLAGLFETRVQRG